MLRSRFHGPTTIDGVRRRLKSAKLTRLCPTLCLCGNNTLIKHGVVRQHVTLNYKQSAPWQYCAQVDINLLSKGVCNYPLFFKKSPLLKISNPRILTKVGLAKVESGTAGTIRACAPCIYPWRRRLRSGTAWQRSLGPTPVVRSVGDLRICGRYTIPGAIRGRAAQKRAHRPFASHAKSV